MKTTDSGTFEDILLEGMFQWKCNMGGSTSSTNILVERIFNCARFTDPPHLHKQETTGSDTIQATSFLSRKFWGKGRFVKKNTEKSQAWNEQKTLLSMEVMNILWQVKLITVPLKMGRENTVPLTLLYMFFLGMLSANVWSWIFEGYWTRILPSTLNTCWYLRYIAFFSRCLLKMEWITTLYLENINIGQPQKYTNIYTRTWKQTKHFKTYIRSTYNNNNNNTEDL